jgi:hypothetical protein
MDSSEASAKIRECKFLQYDMEIPLEPLVHSFASLCHKQPCASPAGPHLCVRGTSCAPSFHILYAAPATNSAFIYFKYVL